jgi:uncharacterized protein YciI
MEFFIYCRDRDGSGPLRERLVEAHWSFMDRYETAMIARGPTLTPDGTAATGSMHIVDLSDAEAARVFAFEEPNYLAGVYCEVLVRRWRNLLGRTMWDFQGDPNGGRRFLVIGHGWPDAGPAPAGLPEAHRRFLGDPERRRRLIAHGPLLAGDGTTWLGSATLVEVPDRADVDTLLAGDPYARAGRYAEVEVHHWTFGGRR